MRKATGILMKDGQCTSPVSSHSSSPYAEQTERSLRMKQILRKSRSVPKGGVNRVNCLYQSKKKCSMAPGFTCKDEQTKLCFCADAFIPGILSRQKRWFFSFFGKSGVFFPIFENKLKVHIIFNQIGGASTGFRMQTENTLPENSIQGGNTWLNSDQYSL